ncbi:MAG: TIGR02452 family protein [Sphingobacteriia bacterium]|nr:TIGR02452 family protein [Sphingobacteriia bacterium]
MIPSECPHELYGEAGNHPDPDVTEVRLVALPCLDSEARAQRCHADLAVSRESAARLGRSALEAIEHGVYVDPADRPVHWGEAVAAAVAAKRSLPPDAALPPAPAARWSRTRVQVANETTLVAAKRLTETGERVLALNFANGIEPGGGFLNGARAQEEVLCRSSALYATLRGDPMYDAHRQRTLPDSTDWAILSPDVPVFRADDGSPLEAHWPLSFSTCAAPYAPGVGQPRAGDLLQQRIARVLDIARAHGYTALVLGAWGCGAFGNDPHRTARDFHDALMLHAGAFSEVVFAIADWSPERRFLAPFAERFGGVG